MAGGRRGVMRTAYMLWHHCKLSLMIILSVIVFTVLAVVGCAQGKLEFSWSYEHPILASFLLNETAIEDDEDDTLLADNDNKNVDNKGKDVKNTEDKPITASSDGSADASMDASGEASEDAIEIGVTEFKPIKKTKVKSNYYSDPGVLPMTTTYDYKKVDESYFEDALFIGDSRIVGLETYSGLKDIATFYAEEGLTVYSMFENKIAKVPGSKKAVTIDKALKQTSFAKIYIMVGINELGTGNTERYKEQYEKNLNTLRSLQPNAKIIVMSVMRVTASKGKDKVINNININDKNVAAAELVNGIDTFYFDINPLYVTKSGNIKSSYTWDGVHLKAEYYADWVDFLCEHGI